MLDLSDAMVQWVFSATGLVHFIAALLLAWVAARLSPQRGVATFLLAALLVGAVACLPALQDHQRLRLVMASVLWVYSIVFVYALVLGVMVAKSQRPPRMLFAAMVLFVVLAPLSLLSAIYIGCHVGQECP